MNTGTTTTILKGKGRMDQGICITEDHQTGILEEMLDQ